MTNPKTQPKETPIQPNEQDHQFQTAITHQPTRQRLRNIGNHLAALAAIACEQHGPFNSAHETYAVIAEELEEFWAEVKKKRDQRDPRRLAQELEDIGAAVIKALAQLENA